MFCNLECSAHGLCMRTKRQNWEMSVKASVKVGSHHKKCRCFIHEKYLTFGKKPMKKINFLKKFFLKWLSREWFKCIISIESLRQTEQSLVKFELLVHIFSMRDSTVVLHCWECEHVKRTAKWSTSCHDTLNTHTHV